RDPAVADQPVAAGAGRPDRGGHAHPSRLLQPRRAGLPVPGPRAAWPRPALFDREGNDAALAVPAPKGAQVPAVIACKLGETMEVPMRKTTRNALATVAVAAAATFATAVPADAYAANQYLPNLVYRTGPYAPNG